VKRLNGLGPVIALAAMAGPVLDEGPHTLRGGFVVQNLDRPEKPSGAHLKKPRKLRKKVT